MARKTPTLSLLPMPSPPSTAPSPVSPSLTGVVPATAPGSPGRPCRELRREPTCEMGGAKNGAVPLRPAPFSDLPSPLRDATMSGRLTPGAATTAPVPTESRTRAREPPSGRTDRSVAGGVHSEDAGVKEEGGEWCMTSSSKDEDEWGMLSSDKDGEVHSPCPFRAGGTGMGMEGVVERRGGDMVAAAGRREKDKGMEVEKLRPNSTNCQGGRGGKNEEDRDEASDDDRNGGRQRALDAA